MADAKPGEHPITDIVTHGLTVFGEDVDGVIRSLMAARPGLFARIEAHLPHPSRLLTEEERQALCNGLAALAGHPS